MDILNLISTLAGDSIIQLGLAAIVAGLVGLLFALLPGAKPALKNEEDYIAFAIDGAVKAAELLPFKGHDKLAFALAEVRKSLAAHGINGQASDITTERLTRDIEAAVKKLFPPKQAA